MDLTHMDIDFGPSQLRARPQMASTGSHGPDALPLRSLPAMSSETNVDPTTALRGSRQAGAFQASPTSIFAKPAAQQSSAGLLGMHEEVKVRILSHVPAQTVASVCRATCQELHNFIVGHESKIADAIEKREIARLQEQSDRIKSFGVPDDLKEFIDGVRLFTRQRGMVARKRGMLQSLNRWVNHIFRNTAHHGSSDAAKLARLAADLIGLQQKFHQGMRKGKQIRNRRRSFMLNNRTWDFVSNRQVEALYDLVEASSRNKPFFPGRNYVTSRTERLTWPMIRLTMAWDDRQAFHPTVPYEQVHLLGLPKLPQDKIFFYFVRELWVQKAISKGSLHGLKKAAVLELIKIF